MKATHLWVVLLALLLIGCGKSHGPIASGVDEDDMSATTPRSSHSGAGNRVVWGLWKISISADRSTIDVVPDRTGGMHFNIVQLLEYHPCATCLKFSNVKLFPNGDLSVDLTVIHPFPGLLQYTGFDLRGVIISGAGYNFPVSGRSIARGDDILRVLNADGYTHLFNPTDFPPTTPPILGYIPGKMSPGGDLSATLNPFFAYEQDQPRCMFLPGTVSTRTILVHIPDGPLEFGYAVDVSWFPADGEVTDPENDFPAEANAMEAYKISVEVGEEPCPVARDEEVRVEVFDHQGLETIDSVTVEVPDLFTGEVELVYTETTAEGSFVFTGTISNEHATSKGPHPLLVRVTGTETDGNLGIVDAWQVRDVMAEIGWARTWGGQLKDGSNDVTVDSSGNVYVVGTFQDAVDFDPGSGEDEHSSNGKKDVFLSKFDSYGVLQWTRTWGGSGTDYAHGVAVDSSGNIVVAGGYHHTVDFDPSPGIDSRDSSGEVDVFVSKFDTSGTYQWIQTWGGVDGEWAEDIAIDSSGSIYTTGTFYGPVDFDPGPGIEERTPDDINDAFVSKLDDSGTFQWVVSWNHGSDYDGDMVGYGIAVDASDDIYVVGHFMAMVDFDTGPEEELHNCIAGWNSFLCKYDPGGTYQWASTWGGFGLDCAFGVAVDNLGSIYVTGKFWGLADFDPTDSGTDERDSGGDVDMFLSRFDSSGAYFWVATWEGAGVIWETGKKLTGISVDGVGDVLVTGKFLGSVDFDPGPGTDYYQSNGDFDVFLSNFDSSGSFQWARTWGGIYEEECHSVACDSSANIYVSGSFHDTVDFDPGPCTSEFISNGQSDLFLSKFLPDGNW